MTSPRPFASRRALAPLSAMAILGLAAGFLVGQDVVRVRASRDATRLRPAVQSTTTIGSTNDGAAGRNGEPQPANAVQISDHGRYRFLLTQPGNGIPIRWNPCRPLRYKIALRGGVPESEIPYVRAAFDAVSEALDAVHLYDGTTDVVPDVVDDSARAGADVVFAFAESGSGKDRSSLLSGWEAGRGGFAAAPRTTPDGDRRQRPTNGSVVIDSSKWAVMTRHDRTVLYLHEIGHVVGLDHPKDTRQIMSSGAYDLPPRYQPGDLAGFAKLGRTAGCE